MTPLLRLICLVLQLSLILSGCIVISAVDTVGSAAIGVVGLAADATIGTVKIVGKGVGKAADAITADKPVAAAAVGGGAVVATQSAASAATPTTPPVTSPTH